MTTLLREVEAHLERLGMPEGWATYDTGSDKPVNWCVDGIMFLRKNRVIVMCIIDVHRTGRNYNGGKGPLALEVFCHRTSIIKAPKWEVLIGNIPTPEDAANAALVYMTLGAPNEV